jgi:hypothetical protein
MSFFGKIFGRETTLTINVTEQDKKEILEKVDSSESSEEVSVTVSMLKIKQNDVLRDEVNVDYERNKFLYSIGFTNLKRVKDFIITMNKVDNIVEFNEKEKRYKKYGLQFLSSDMVNTLKRTLGLKSEIHSKYDGSLPNPAIDLLKVNYNKLTDDYSHYNFYKQYYETNTPELTTSTYQIDRFLSNKKKELTEYLTIGSTKKSILYDSYYWTAKPKPMTVLYNNVRGLIIIEVEDGYHLILSEWDESTQPSDKMNFKEFIKNNIIPK